MSEPTKVTSMTKVIDSGSIIKPKFTENSPAGIHEKSGSSKRRVSGAAESMAIMTPSPTAKDAHDARVARR